MTERRFPPPWSVEKTDPCFIVRDAHWQALAYVYCEDEPGRRTAAKLLTRDEAHLLCTLIGCPGHSPSAYCSGTDLDLVHQGGGSKSGASNAGAPLDRRGEHSKRPAVSHLFSRARWRGYRIVQRPA